jgi:hypothetical protein
MKDCSRKKVFESAKQSSPLDVNVIADFAGRLIRAGLPDRKTALNHNNMEFAGYTAKKYMHRLPAPEAHR